MNSSTQLSEIAEQLRLLSERLGRIEDKLMLVTDIDRYGKLQEFLMAGKLEEADTETASIILIVANKDRETFTPNDILAFPCDVLQVIDRLWKTYSKDRFGFSVQMSIYLDIGGNTETLLAQDVELLRQFGEQVGWRKDEAWIDEETYEQSDFSSNAPVGFFPAIWWKSPYGAKMVYFCFSRLLSCSLYEA